MGLFTVTVATAGAIEKRIRRTLKRIAPNKYRPFIVEDFDDIRGLSGVLLCKGTIFLRLAGCKFTHAAIYHKSWVYESSDGIGVHKLSYEEFIAEYLHGYNEVHFYQFSPGFDQKKFEKEFKKVDGMSYEKHSKEFIRSKHHKNKTQFLDSFFCSQVVAYLLQRMGILSIDILSSNFTPDDFPDADYVNGHTLKRIF